MADRYYNPFQSSDLTVPVELHESFTRYCQTAGNTTIDQSPFPRMVDMWFLALCVAAREGLKPVDTSKLKTTKIIDGAIFSSDPWRVQVLMLVAVAQSGEVEIVSDQRRMMVLLNGLAVAGLPRLIDMIKDGDAEPIWNLSDAVEAALKQSAA